MAEPLGIIYPPPDLRTIVDTAANFVARNGREFESRIRQNEQNNPRFNFLNAGDPYHAYYEHKIRESLEQSNKPVAPEPVATAVSDHDQTSTEDDNVLQATSDNDHDKSSDDISTNQTIVDNHGTNNVPNGGDSGISLDPADVHKLKLDDAVLDKVQAKHDNQKDILASKPVVKKLKELFPVPSTPREPPPEFEFIADPPSSMTVLDLEIIKLTAQFVAMHGRNFLTELLNREQNNAQFDFLRPQHGQFNYFTLLIEQYSKILNHNNQIVELLTKDATNQQHVISKARMRSEWSKMQEAERQRKEEEEELERLQYAQIDWHDFVVVETVDYQPGERGPYPPPTTADQVGSRVLLQQRLEEQNVPEEMEIDMDVESDEDQQSNDGQEDLVPPALVEFLPPKPEAVLIKKDYDPKQKEKTAPKPDSYFVSSITNELVPADKLQSHVKYSLIDSRSIELKNRVIQERANQEDVFASGAQVENSLKQFAERRTDIFGSADVETAIGRKINEEEDPLALVDPSWDGHRAKKKK